MQIITNSEVSTFRKCPALWGFRYADQMEPMVSEIGVRSWGTVAHSAMRAGLLAMMRGLLGVDVLDAAHAAVDAATGSTPTEEEKTQASEVKAVVYLALLRWPSDHKILAVEAPFSIKIPGIRAVYEGQIDVITMAPDGCPVVWDHKFTASVDGYESRLQLDTQSVGYLLGAQQVLAKLKIKPPGKWGRFAWNLVRRRVPPTPKTLLLKKGEANTPELLEALKLQELDGTPRGYVSAAACDTTAEAYQSALLEQALSRFLPITHEQSQRLDDIKGQAHRWSRVEEHWIDEDQLGRWKSELAVVARRMRLAMRHQTERTRSPEACATPQSGRCDFRDPCLLDSPEVRALYQIRTKKHQEIVTDE